MNLALALIFVPLVGASSANGRFLLEANSYFPNLDDDAKLPYTSWLNDNAPSYDGQTFLPTANDPDNGVAMFWKVSNDTVDFAIAVPATGWVGFGISEAGGMAGADVAVFETSTSQLIDSYILEDKAAPLADGCQDWKMTSSLTENDWIIIEINRKLNTGDAQDHEIKNDRDLWVAPTRIIAAWGDVGNVSYHGMNRARSSVRLFADPSTTADTVGGGLTDVLEVESDGYFEVREQDFEVPANETYYHEFCKTIDELKDQVEGTSAVAVIGVVPVITEETTEVVHHFAVYSQPSCNDEYSSKEMIYAWAPGDEGWALPSDVGFPMFHDDAHQAIFIQLHYNNPGQREGMRDSSGIRFYYTKEQRAHNAGILQLGDPLMGLNGQSINEGLTKYSFTCPEACSSMALKHHSVTVLAEYLHMHETGKRMTNEVIRNNEVAHTSIVDVWDFDQQGNFHAQQQPYEFRAGDSFRTTCYYKDGGTFGMSSKEEMCITFVLYYPAISYSVEFGNTTLTSAWVCPYLESNDYDDIFVCQQDLERTNLSSEDELGRNFGVPASECAVSNASETSDTMEESGAFNKSTVETFSVLAAFFAVVISNIF